MNYNKRKYENVLEYNNFKKCKYDTNLLGTAPKDDGYWLIKSYFGLFPFSMCLIHFPCVSLR